jgi:co-chaperonin GroES (HSP10)
MYEAFNERVIAITLEGETLTSTGLILVDNHNACVKYKVVHTNELTKELQDRVVYAESRWQNHQLPEKGENGETYVIIPIKEILAVKK